MACGALLQLGRAHQRGHGTGHTFKVIGQGAAALFFIFERIPVRYTFVTWLGAKNIWVPLNQLLAYAIADLFPGKAAGFLFHAGMESNLHQHIAQLFTHQHRVIQVQCVHSLIRFFQEVHPNRCMGLNFIPRTAVDRIPQKGDNADKIICRVRAIVRIFHACCNAACPGCTRVRLKKQQATSYLSFYRFVKETIQVAV